MNLLSVVLGRPGLNEKASQAKSQTRPQQPQQQSIAVLTSIIPASGLLFAQSLKKKN